MDVPSNILTVDCEEWFVAETLAGKISRDQWKDQTSTVEKNSQRLLDLFYKYNAKATWFILGWVADHFPNLLRDIEKEGHEIACHSYFHKRVDQMSPDEFSRDTIRAVEAIESAIGKKPIGYRAPSWSLNKETSWAFDILSDIGFEYDSSLFPIKHDIYGVPDGPSHTVKMKSSSNKIFYEVPASTYKLFGKNIPIAGGGHFRHAPFWYTKKIIDLLNRNGRSAMVYIHPWELDPNPPKVEGLSFLQKFRMYGSVSVLEYKFCKLLESYNYITVREYLKGQKRQQIGFR